jgi:ATP-dependent RNA helicase DDX60
VWAIHTRDYRVNNSTGCQILVTVPHILQIVSTFNFFLRNSPCFVSLTNLQMLLSPSNANSWARRVKCIIFDEIHVIGQAEDGIVYEQLLLV